MTAPRVVRGAQEIDALPVGTSGYFSPSGRLGTRLDDGWAIEIRTTPVASRRLSSDDTFTIWTEPNEGGSREALARWLFAFAMRDRGLSGPGFEWDAVAEEQREQWRTEADNLIQSGVLR